MRNLWTWFLDQFHACEATRWCLKCEQRVRCDYGRNHKGRLHGHVPKPYSRQAHILEWFDASR